MNKKISLILFIIITLFLAALISRNGSLSLLTIPFLIYLGSGLLEAPGRIQLHAKREISTSRCNENMPFHMELTIENLGGPIPRVQLGENTMPGMHLLDGTPEQLITLDNNNQISTRYDLQAQRGRYRWETTRLTVSDSFGLFTKDVYLKAAAFISVQPERIVLRNFKYRPLPNIRTAGTNLSRLPGSGIDFWGVREYQSGDSMRSIHWRLTARHPRSFFSKVYEREEMADIGLLLDARTITNCVQEKENLIEYSIQATATLARHFIAAGNRVSMLILNDRLVRVFPGYGKRQLMHILDELSGCTLGERVTFGTLKYLPVKLFPSHSVIVLVSPLIPDDFNFIYKLQAEGYQMLVISPNPDHGLAQRLTANTYDSMAFRAAALERAILLWQIQRAGVQLIDWDTHQSLTRTLQSTRFVKM